MKRVVTTLWCILFITIIMYAQNANTTLSNLTSPVKVNTHLLPDKNNTRNLGSSAKAWKNLYLDSSVYLGGTNFIRAAPAKGGFGYGFGNEAIGLNALVSFNPNTGPNGTENLAVGEYTLNANTTGVDNTALGQGALQSNISGSDNTAGGDDALALNDKGSNNTAYGSYALYINQSGNSNTAVGFRALYYAKGSYLVGIGYSALANNSGAHCTAVGSQAGLNNSFGDNNSYFGYHAGNTVTTGGSNTIIGYGADVSSGSLSNATAVGNLAVSGASNRVRIGNGSVTSIGGAVGWTNFSDERIKTNIKQDVPGLAFINLLKPVTYNFDLNKEEQVFKRKDSAEWKEKYDIQKIKFTGFLAQEVEAAAKKINYDFAGVDKPANDKDVYGLRYADFVVPMVKAVQELSKQNDSLNLKMSEFENLKIENARLEQRIAKLETIMRVQAASSSNSSINNLSVANLSQNTPNPFSNSTTISYSIPQSFSSAKIIVTDKNGTAMKEINLSSDKGSVNVDASTLLSGTYQYSLYADGKLVASKQFIISK